MAAAAPRAFALILASLLLAGYTADPQEESGTGPGGRESAGTTYEHATGPDDVVISVTGRMLDDGAEGLGFGLNTTAAFVLLGHGTAIVPGVFDFAPVDGIDPVYPEIVPLSAMHRSTRTPVARETPTTSSSRLTCSARRSWLDTQRA